jgi:hypothetical protein
LTAAAAAVLTVAALFVAPALVEASPQPHLACAGGYAYAGYATRGGVRGIAATIMAVERPRVANGHAAAWVGVGGIRAGRNGSTEWLQAGVAAFPRAGLRLYVEAVPRGRPRRLVDLGPARAGQRYRIRVVEVGANVWQAVIDGAPVGPAAFLPPARGSWRGVVTSESWLPGRTTCNRYAYRFDRVAVRGTDWAQLRAAAPVGHAVALRGAGFSVKA